MGSQNSQYQHLWNIIGLVGCLGSESEKSKCCWIFNADVKPGYFCIFATPDTSPRVLPYLTLCYLWMLGSHWMCKSECQRYFSFLWLAAAPFLTRLPIALNHIYKMKQTWHYVVVNNIGAIILSLGGGIIGLNSHCALPKVFLEEWNSL